VFAHREVRVGIGVAVTDRHGGVSGSPWDTLNLADHVGDDEAAVQENRRRVHAGLGDGAGPLVTMRQVHGAAVAVVDTPTGEPPEADALVTQVPGLTLVVQVADCTPVLLWDRRARVVAAVHVGRRGLAAGVLPAAIEVMTDLHARPERCYAVVGPGVCPEHYEVPRAMHDDVTAAVPRAAATTSAGTPALDIRSGVLDQLHGAGVRQWMVMPQCTAETPAFYSHRRDNVTGRFGGLVWMTP
jgi:YfiH family protein